MSLLGIAQLLTPWNQIGHHHPHFLFHAGFCEALLLITATNKNLALQTMTWKEMENGESPNCETMSYLE